MTQRSVMARVELARELRRALTLFLAAFLTVIGIAACAPAAPQGDAVAKPVPPDKVRIYVYRDLYLYDAQVWTAVSLNGETIGDSAPGTVFYRDVLPGTYEIEVRSDFALSGSVQDGDACGGARSAIEGTTS
jgi:hypothetical protein